MAFKGLEETIATLNEVSTSLVSISSDSVDKKAISDVMLALEKILPLISSDLSPQSVRLCKALALLYEKFLMESVDDIDSGVGLTAKGIKIIESIASEDGEISILHSEADEIVATLADKYQLDIPGVPAVPATTAPEPEASNDQGNAVDVDEDDSFFAELSNEPEHQPLVDEESDGDGGKDDPLLTALDSIANDVTMMDEDHSDKKQVADMMMAFEGMVSDITGSGAPASIIGLAEVLAALYEKSLMEGLSDCDKANAMSTEGVKIVLAFAQGQTSTDEVIKQADQLLNSLKGEFDVGAGAPGIEPVKSETGKGYASPGEAPPPAKTEEPVDDITLAGEDLVVVSSEDDMLIYTEFVIETADTIHAIESELLELENDPADEELINNLFRAFHSLKGAAGFLGVNTMNVSCHEAETLLDKLRKKELVCNQEMIDAFLKAVDVIRNVNDGLSIASDKAKEELPNASLMIPRFEITGLVGLLNRLSNLEEESLGDEDGEDKSKLGEILVDQKVITSDQLEHALGEQRPLGKILVDMGAADEKSVSDALQIQSKAKKKVHISSLKVDTEKLDHLLELVGELVISQSIVVQDDVLNEDINRLLTKNLNNLGKITKNIQDKVMALRMVPLKQTFQKMSRLVRDLSKKMNKKVQFNSNGEETEIDKTIIEELNDPLVHLLRNSMDHGLEETQERLQAGKPEIGNVTLNAYHRGGNVHIEIIDDGRGLNINKIRSKAVKNGLIDEDDDLSDQDLHDLIFMAGFSTHDVATDVSGRGVGMDVVRSNIEKLGGKVEISSKTGEGSTMTLKLPLTMAIVDGMIVGIGKERFIIPTISIRESIRPEKADISAVQRSGEMINVRGHLMPLIRLHSILKIKDAQYQNAWEGLVIIVETEDHDFGFLVDDLLGQQQVVIKSLGKRFKGLSGISGGTILGDGRVGLILDVGGIVEMN